MPVWTKIRNFAHRFPAKKYVIPVVASTAALFFLLIALTIWWNLKRRRQQGKITTGLVTEKTGSLPYYKYPCSKRLNKLVITIPASVDNANDSILELEHRCFTYSEVLSMTDNFKMVLGKGGFGTVYHGYLDDTQVAVKMFSSSSGQGYKEFQAEVKLLMRIHHRNLTNFVGYCNEGTDMGLIYEYIANGNLQQLLSDRSALILSWEDRLRIAMDAAQAGGNHVSTVVAGTPGYLDPEYYVTEWLNEKTDVYSFGVVLLEIITSRPVITKHENENTHKSQWVTEMIATGDIGNIVDPSLQGDFETNSARKAVKLAMACGSYTSAKRPTMNEVVMELKECLALESARKTNC
ncbi:hypothetical protein Pint_29527 [Pistacia integerrima]|uniref:Uncharacterized protein n=1 Tax=Pistacia integerrima TaxID=434235 RepID=A0ACC0X2C5_9ROSI|nr:hypothetical protein Pint_29527 [Pistacia integerrima]